MNQKKEGNKRGQITVFVILAIAIIIIVILLFLGKDFTNIFTTKPPIDQIKECAQNEVQNGINILNVQGGSINPENYYLYDENGEEHKVEYLCYAEKYYEKCIVQKPLLKQSIEKELEDFSQKNIENCIESVKASLKDKGYSVSSEKPEIKVEIVPNTILISINNLNLKISKEGTESYNSIKTDLNSRLYDLIIIASSIINWEARYGDSESLNFMMYYPSLRMEKKLQSDGTTIYILTNKNTLDKFMFASRSAALPVGITGN